MSRAQPLDESLVVLARYKLVLAAREKRAEIFQELSRLGEPPKQHEVKLRDVAAQQNLMVDIFERLDAGVGALQNLFQAEFVERAEPDAFSALARGFHHAMLHLACGFVREREAENIFAGEVGIRFEQVANALGNHPCFARPRARHHEQRPFAVLDGGALVCIQRKATGARRNARVRRRVLRILRLSHSILLRWILLREREIRSRCGL